MVIPRLRLPFITYLPAPSASRLVLGTTTLFSQFYSILGTQRPTANHGSLAIADLYSFLGAAVASSPADETYSSPEALETKNFPVLIESFFGLLRGEPAVTATFLCHSLSRSKARICVMCDASNNAWLELESDVQVSGTGIPIHAWILTDLGLYRGRHTCPTSSSGIKRHVAFEACCFASFKLQALGAAPSL